MKIVVMYTRPNLETPFFNNAPGSRLMEYGAKIRKITKMKRVISVDELTMWEFVHIPNPEEWEKVRSEYIDARNVEASRKRSVGVTAELIVLDDGVGEEFFDFLDMPQEELEKGVLITGVDVDISKFFW